MSTLQLVLILALALAQPARPVDTGIASLYRPWRKGPLVPYASYPGRPKVAPKPSDLVCAARYRYGRHRIRFGTVLRLVSVTRAGKVRGIGLCMVLDRGPYGTCEPSPGHKGRRCPEGYKWGVNVKAAPPGGWYRGVVDATPDVHKMMRSSGWTRVRMEILKAGK